MPFGQPTMTTKYILILEPSGAVSINPNLTAIISFLCEKGFHVDIVSTKRHYAQAEVCANSSLFLCVPGAYEENLEQYRNLKIRYDLVIGVDQAIVSAAFIAAKMGAPLAFISYEILFADEVGEEFKRAEIEACKNVSFAISQDRVRGYLVSREYGIPLEKILCVPVSGSARGDVGKTQVLRKHFRIAEEKRIAIFTGAVSGKSMIHELLSSVGQWPDDWVLVVHSYAGIRASDIGKFKRKHDLSRVYFSDMKIDSIDELLQVIASADLGVCLFKPSLETRYEGKNMLFIGLSSGKFSLYLKAGLPVMINEVGEMSELVRTHGLGRVVSSASDINPGFLDHMHPEDIRRRCRELCARCFDFDTFSADLLAAVTDCVNGARQIGTGRGIDPAAIQREIGQINRLSEWFNEVARIRISRSYKAGESMFHPASLAAWLYATAKPLLKKMLRRDGGDFIERFNTDIVRFYSS